MTRFKLLLTYLQNGIQEPWQKIPTILAVFVAEASVVLLDPSHEHYPAVNKFLLQSPRINLKVCPAEINSTIRFPSIILLVGLKQVFYQDLSAHTLMAFAVDTSVS